MKKAIIVISIIVVNPKDPKNLSKKQKKRKEEFNIHVRIDNKEKIKEPRNKI